MRCMSDYAVYLGDGVRWQITKRDYERGRWEGWEMMYRPPTRRFM
jgi:hypothetical protein